MRYVCYKSKDVMYYFITNYYNWKVMPPHKIFKLYLNRWPVETEFYFMSYYGNFQNIRSQTINRIKRDIAFGRLAMINIHFLKYLSDLKLKEKENEKNKREYKTNTKVLTKCWERKFYQLL